MQTKRFSSATPSPRVGARHYGIGAAVGLSLLLTAGGAQAQAGDTPKTQTALPAGATISRETPDLVVTLAQDSQTVVNLRPKSARAFDFAPSDRQDKRQGNGFYNLGDLTLRIRTGGATAWQELSTAAARMPVRALPIAGKAFAMADLAPTLPADCPLQITRTWSIEDGKLALGFTVTNRTQAPVEIGALGIPLVFNNIITDRSLENAHENCAFSDPYIGQDAGYVQVTRLSGTGPALVVIPDGKTPLEAYRPLPEPMRPNQTFEGMYAWTAHSKAYAENEWKSASQWNPATGVTLAPGETRRYGLRFLLSPSIRSIEATLAASKRPVAVGMPGYVLPMDVDGKLFLRYGRTVKSVAVEPAGAVTVTKGKSRKPKDGKGGTWQGYTVSGKTYGRARVTVTYDDGTTQAISYYVTKPASQTVADLGRFLFNEQWFVDANDPFHRSPSVISYDHEAKAQVTQDSRVWIAGLGDEGGSGAWVAAAMKQFVEPSREEIAKYEQFVDGVLWGGLQYKDGPQRYGVRKSLFFYEPDKVPGFTYDAKRDWRSWTSWNVKATEDIGRGYNYPHVVAAYWALYRAGRRDPSLLTRHDWNWYLDQAYETTRFMFGRKPDGERRVGYVELGLMEGTIFREVLLDLKREGRTAQATEIETLMRERADRWKTEAYPFGSEMAWDSTGQEEVYAWCRYFGLTDKAQVSLNSILGYMPTVPHWGYNGNARRYWDFLYGGKLSRIERQLHHYGSGLNAIPVLTEYRDHPDDLYLLRVGYGGAMGPLTNIAEDGFASAAFHSNPSTLKWDAYSGDYGPNFFGHAMNVATYLIDDADFGWQSFGGNVAQKGEWASLIPKDASRQRVYIAPRGLWLTLDAGTFRQIDVNTRTHAVRVELARDTTGGATTPGIARLRIEQPARIAGVGTYRPVAPYARERDAFTVPLTQSSTWIELTDTP